MRNEARRQAAGGREAGGEGKAGRHGTKKGDLSQFVEEAVQARLFQLTVQDVKQRNRGYPQDEILAAIDEALANG